MKKLPPHTPAWEDGPAPEMLRGLLDAGSSADLGGYDLEAGLAQHLAHVRAGTPLPEWANELVASSATTSSTTAGSGALATTATSGALKLLPFVLVPLASAGLVATVLLTSPEGAREPSAPGAPIAAPAVSRPASTPASPEPVEPRAASPALTPSAEVVAPAPVEPAAAVAKASALAASPEPSEAQRRSEEALRTIRRVAETRRASQPESSAKAASSEPRRTPESAGLDPAAVADLPSTPRDVESEPAERAEQAPARPQAIDDSQLEREMGMLAMAQRVLASDPERALRLARQGEQEFAGSMFTQERQQVLLLALIELGRTSEAKRLAKPYLQRYPNGPFSDRLRRALANAR